MRHQLRVWATVAVVAVVVAAAGCTAATPPPSRPRSSEPAPSAATTQTSSAFPAAVVDFAGALGKWAPWSEEGTTTAWYPSYLPAGYSLASIETTVFDVEQDSGPVCDIVFARGKSKIYFSQGSPVMRDYEVVPVASVPWGSASADTMAASAGGKVDLIVYTDAGNLAELGGSVSLKELQKIAASMQPVR